MDRTGDDSFDWDRRRGEAKRFERLEARIDALTGKVDTLVLAEEQRKGRRALYSDISKWTSWLVALLAIGAAALQVVGVGG